MSLQQLESRFKIVTGLSEIDFNKFPIEEKDYKQQSPKTDKTKSKKHGEVFTPIFLIDKMLQETNELKADKSFLDLCAGTMQFSIRYLRKMVNEGILNEENFEEYLKEKLFLIEIQAESCAKITYIAGPQVNLYCGSVFNLQDAEETDRGILFYNKETKKWENNKYYQNLIQYAKDDLPTLINIFKEAMKENE